MPRRFRFRKRRLGLGMLAGLSLLLALLGSPARAQIPGMLDSNLAPEHLISAPQNGSDSDSRCIWLDGRCLFEIAAPKTALWERAATIQGVLNNTILPRYLGASDPQLKLQTEKAKDSLALVVSLGSCTSSDCQWRLMNVTAQDAALRSVSQPMRARQIASQLRQGLERAQRERQPAYMRAQARKAAALGAAALLASTAIYWRWQRRYRRSKQALAAAEAPPNPPTATRLNRRQNRHLSEVGHRLLQLAQIGIWLGSSLTACSLFPQTRIIPIFIASSFGLPLKIALVGFGIYLIVRLSYALIDRLTALLANNALMTPEANWRLQLRASTISGVAKSIATGSWLVIGMLAGLTAMGVNTGPLLAGAGLIGVGLSFAAQNLIRDFINGFLIVLEDQYAVGDWIAVSSPNGDVGGLVEKSACVSRSCGMPGGGWSLYPTAPLRWSPTSPATGRGPISKFRWPTKPIRMAPSPPSNAWRAP